MTTYTTDEMASMLLDLCDIESKVAAAREPLQVDLTGGLADVDLDMSELAAKAREEMTAEAAEDDARGRTEPSVRCRRRRGATRPRRRRRGTTSTSTRPIWWSSSAAPNSGRTARRAPASRWRSTTSCRRPVCSSWPGPRAWSSGKTTRRRAGTTPRPASWSTRASWWSATTTRSSSGSASASSSTTARSTPITPRRCWFRCSSTRTSRSWCRRRPMPGRSWSSIRSTPSSRPCRTVATGRSPARRAPRFGCRARRSCHARSARRSPPGSTRWCTGSARR